MVAVVADLVKDHRDCSLEQQPGGKENRRKRESWETVVKEIWINVSIMSKVLLQRTCGLFGNIDFFFGQTSLLWSDLAVIQFKGAINNILC